MPVSSLPSPRWVALGLMALERLALTFAYFARDLAEVWPLLAISIGVPVPSSASRVSAE